jgi:uncharacterized membrane protein
MDERHPSPGTPRDKLRTAALGFAGGLRLVMPFAVESLRLAREGPDIADGGWTLDLLAHRRVAVVLGLGALVEIAIDKTPYPPTRVEPLPLAGRVIASGSACALSCLAEGRTSTSGALIGSVAAVAGSVFGYSMRTRLPLPAWLLAVAEDALALALGLWAVQH